ncbi:hypothetical protein [Streptomyces sp. NPDC101165]|uniref:hypothetical protein n=1 Tax=Streptomyces sp. NPDC101165 TaxID=3366119 RepID=UPI0038228C32
MITRAQDEPGASFEAMNPAKKNVGYRTSAVSVQEMEALANEVALLRDAMFRTGWNSRAAKMPGMRKIPPPPDGVTVPE